MKKGSFIVTAALVAALATAGCNSRRTTTGDEVSVILAQMLDSLVGTLTLANNDVEQDAAIAQALPALPRQPLERLFSQVLGALPAQAASCSTSRFSPTLGGSSCGALPTNLSVAITYGSCSAGPSPQATLSGSSTLTFSDKTACDTWLSGATPATGATATLTTADFTRTDFDRGTTGTNTSSQANYLGTTIGGGIKTTYNGAARTIEITGLRRNHASGSLGDFDHTVHSTANLALTGTKSAGTRAISSGTLVIDDNLEKYSASVALTSLTWSSSCCYPTGGTATATLTGSLTGTATLSFATGTCGRVSLVNPFGQSATVTLQACE